MKNYINSLNDHLFSKLSNPYWGTLLFVWLVHNWRLIYASFNFPENMPFNDRIRFLAYFLDGKELTQSILHAGFIAFFVLILSYLAMSISKVIVNIYNDMVIPYVSKITNKSSIVLKIDYEKLYQEVSTLESKLDEERRNRITKSKEYDELYIKYIDATSSTKNDKSMTFGEEHKDSDEELIPSKEEHKDSNEELIPSEEEHKDSNEELIPSKEVGENNNEESISSEEETTENSINSGKEADLYIGVRALLLFNELSANEGYTISSISNKLNIKKSEAYNLLLELAKAGFINSAGVGPNKEIFYVYTTKGHEFLIKNGFLD